MEQFLATETLIIELLLVVSLVAIAVRRLRLPYTVALGIVGLLLTVNQELSLDLTPELILALFVPPLVFEAAFHIEFGRLRENLLLAIPGVLLTTGLVGLIVSAAAAALDEQIGAATQAQHELLEEHPHLRDEERDDARREGLRAERAMLSSLASGGVISERVYEELVSEVDAKLGEGH